MADVDDIMARCPLKHEVRACLWQKYAQKVAGGRTLSSYLTLYSPPLMDVKWLVECNLLKLDGGRYVGVVGATWDDASFAKAQTQLSGRPDLLLRGDINELLVRPTKSEYGAQFLARFPFQVINLDYTNSLFGSSLKEMSKHLDAIDSLIHLQKSNNATKFVLLLTTRSEKQMFADDFLEDLRERVDDNIQNTDGFGDGFIDVYSCSNALSLQSKKYPDFIALGLAKLITGQLRDHGYYIKECDAVWLSRDSQRPLRRFLHLAFLIHLRPPPPPLRNIKSIGRRGKLWEREILNFLKKHKEGQIVNLLESRDKARLDKRHKTIIGRLAGQNFEVSVPEAKATPGND